MRYRRFGRTELAMPVLSCGGMRFQHDWDDREPEVIPAAEQENLERTIWRAFELGINHFETARGYGTSEMQLGRVLPQLPRDEILVQTKVAPGAEFRENFEKSLSYLKLDYVDLLSIHGINHEGLLGTTLAPGGALEVARALQREGRVRHVGFSTHAPGATIERAIATGEFSYVNLHWYFVNQFNWPAIVAAARQDMGVFIISPNDKGGRLQAPPAKLVELCAPLSPMAFNDLFCLARPEVQTLSLGAARPSDFDEHVAALAHYDRAAEVTAPIAARLRAEMDRVLGPDWVRGWWEGVPDFTRMPGEVNVVEILRLWSLAKSLDLVEFAKGRYGMLGHAEHWLPGENAGKLNLGELAPRLSASPFAERIPGILQEAHALLGGVEGKRLSQE